MTLDERSRLQASIYKLQADLGSIVAVCHVHRCLSVAVPLVAAQVELNSAMREFMPDDVTENQLEFVRHSKK